jgi:hypothetical protein
MSSPDHMPESLETIFRVKILDFFDADPGSGMEKVWIRAPESGMKKIRIRDVNPESATLISDQHGPPGPETHTKRQDDCLPSLLAHGDK